MSSAQLYDTIGTTYTATRRTEPRIAAQVWAALGDARTVLNVGAGTGSYEPPDRDVTAVEPSAVMRAQRPAGAAPCVDATAERLPFEDQSFDAAMAFATRDILEFFFQIHRPDLGEERVGSDYRSEIFSTSDEQRQVAEGTIADLDASGIWPGKVVTKISEAGAEPSATGQLLRRLRWPRAWPCVGVVGVGFFAVGHRGLPGAASPSRVVGARREPCG